MAHPFVHGTAATDAKLRVPVSCYHPAGSQPVTVRTERSRRDYLKCLCCTRNHILTMTQSHLKALLCHRAGGQKHPPQAPLPLLTAICNHPEQLASCWQPSTAACQNGNQKGVYWLQVAVQRGTRSLCPPRHCLPQRSHCPAPPRC